MVARRLVAGFLAGLSGLAGLLALLAVLLLGFGIISLMRDTAIAGEGGTGPLSVIGPALTATLGAVPGYLWSARWAFLVLGVLGALLASVDAARGRISRPWSDYAGVVVTLGVVAAAVTAGIFIYRETLLGMITDQPQLFTEQRALLLSNTTLLLLAALLALGLTYAAWALWNYWYDKWAGWLSVPRPAGTVSQQAPSSPPSSADDWRAYQAHMAQLKRNTPTPSRSAPAPSPNTPPPRSWLKPVLIGIAAASVLVLLALEAYDETGPDVRTGGVWVTPQAPASTALLQIPRRPRRMVLSNIGGQGTVDLALSTTADAVSLQEIQGMQLANSATRFQTAELSLQDLEPGQYQLAVTLREGRGGLLNYVALYGGGILGTLSALALGFAAGLWAALAALSLLEILGERRMPGAVRRE